MINRQAMMDAAKTLDEYFKGCEKMYLEPTEQGALSFGINRVDELVAVKLKEDEDMKKDLENDSKLADHVENCEDCKRMIQDIQGSVDWQERGRQIKGIYVRMVKLFLTD